MLTDVMRLPNTRAPHASWCHSQEGLDQGRTQRQRSLGSDSISSRASLMRMLTTTTLHLKSWVVRCWDSALLGHGTSTIGPLAPNPCNYVVQLLCPSALAIRNHGAVDSRWSPSKQSAQRITQRQETSASKVCFAGPLIPMLSLPIEEEYQSNSSRKRSTPRTPERKCAPSPTTRQTEYWEYYINTTAVGRGEFFAPPQKLPPSTSNAELF